MRVKAYAFNWSAELFDGELVHKPDRKRGQIMRQLAASLLDERIAL